MPLPPAPAPSNGRKNSGSQNAPMDHYGLLLSTRIDKTAEIITSSDGFEKRYLQRCSRCNLPVGYQLDWQQFAVDRTGRREDYVFLLPGGFVTTRDMIAGKQAAADAASTAAGLSTVSLTEIKA